MTKLLFIFCVVIFIAELVAAKEHEYLREDYRHWIDENGDCYNTRAEVLIRDSQSAMEQTTNEKFPDQCTITTGLWIDPYSGKEIHKTSELDIDHIVPLQHAHKMGAYKWSNSRKTQFANDTENLIAVSKSLNRSKGAKSPEQWRPQLDYWCNYSRKWRRIKQKYSLRITAREDATLMVMESTCKYFD